MFSFRLGPVRSTGIAVLPHIHFSYEIQIEFLNPFYNMENINFFKTSKRPRMPDWHPMVSVT